MFLQLLMSFLIIFERKIPKSWRDCVIVRSLTFPLFLCLLVRVWSSSPAHKLSVQAFAEVTPAGRPSWKGSASTPFLLCHSCETDSKSQHCCSWCRDTATYRLSSPHAAPLCGLFAWATAPDIVLFQTAGLEKDTVLLTTNSPTVILSPIPNSEPCTY